MGVSWSDNRPGEYRYPVAIPSRIRPLVLTFALTFWTVVIFIYGGYLLGRHSVNSVPASKCVPAQTVPASVPAQKPLPQTMQLATTERTTP
jgi:hypothetical protein